MAARLRVETTTEAAIDMGACHQGKYRSQLCYKAEYLRTRQV